MKTKNFHGKICWITGASSGIGEALAKSMSREGAYLILSARSESNLSKVKNECADPAKIVVLPCDLENTDLIKQLNELRATKKNCESDLESETLKL